MRLLTFSVLKNCKLKPLKCLLWRQFCSTCEIDRPPQESEKRTEVFGEDEPLVCISETWPDDCEPELRERVLSDMRVLPEFVSEQEEHALLEELEPVLRRMRYEYDHWDGAIHGFRETERSAWSAETAPVLSRVAALAFAGAGAGGGACGPPLPHQHVLDLAPAGYIKPHVDAVRFCGSVIAGLCLASTAVMRLVHEQRPELAADVLLPRRCLYIMRDCARYEFNHAVLGGATSSWRGQPVARRRRVAVITRARPRPEHAAPRPPPLHTHGVI